MNTCESCSEPVSTQFARVFGDSDGTLWACQSCSTTRDLQQGAGAAPTGPVVDAGIALPTDS